MELATKYSPAEVEAKWYEYWTKHKLFASKPDGREPYTIVIPPPNVTGVLHMGHMLNNTIQDILIRKARLDGKNACWVPGTDHASIATEAKVVNRLAEQGIKKRDLTREEFLKHAWAWTEEHGGIILKQLRKLGASCDWDRTAFTMDEKRSESVLKVFCDLYDKGLIYRGLRMVNWDSKAQTVLSTEEVIYRDEKSKLYYLKYYVEGLVKLEELDKLEADGNIIHKDEKGYYAVVATTRPETIMGDTAMCINPKDPKNQWLRGQKVIVPLVGRVIPVIEDRYVDIEFGTGCLKVTPAHDVNDYQLGKTHNLETIDIFNPDGTISEQSPLYVGMDRMDVRKQIVKDLEAAGLLEKVEDYENKVGYSERNQDTAVEPRLCKQWFLSMKHMADIALPPVLEGKLKFHPTKYVTTYRNWLENIQDWCISRQLWWGHRIPAYFVETLSNSPLKGEKQSSTQVNSVQKVSPLRGDLEGSERFVVALTEEEAYKKALEKYPELNSLPPFKGGPGWVLRRDEDALDTWFSSWLWPISLFDGINNPGNEEIRYYYPTSDLVTGPDIIFFWVARMIMAGEEYMGDIPFRNVYFTGIVRDKLGRKMSKSLGNSPDPLELIAKYGADGVRMGMMLAAPAGNDILYDDALCAQGMAFCNKMWNAFRLVKGWKTIDHSSLTIDHSATPENTTDNNGQWSMVNGQSNREAVRWMQAKLNDTYAEINDLYSKYRLNEALMAAFKLFTDEFSGWYLEMIKPAYQAPIDAKTLAATLDIFDQLLHIIHPFMPFITEELWQHIAERKDGESLMVSVFKTAAPTEDDAKLIAQVEEMKQIVSGVRAIRQSKNISPREPLPLQVIGAAKQGVTSIPALAAIIEKLAGLSQIENVAEKSEGTQAFLVGTDEYAVPLGNLIDADAEREKAETEIKRLQGFMAGIEKKLQNERFVQNAPAQVVELERKKLADAQSKIAALEATIKSLS